jgi:flavin-binding protein dodecin
MSESVYKIIELVGSSPTSWEEAAKNAVETAGKTLKDLRIAEITQMDMKMGRPNRKRQGLWSALSFNFSVSTCYDFSLKLSTQNMPLLL